MPEQNEEQGAASSSVLKAGQKVGAGRYTLVRQLGRGGMGVVWLAHDERLGEEVALKFLPPEVSADAMALDDLRRETQKSRRLTHPHIIRIHDLNETEGEPPFISMEYVAGHNLTDLRLAQPNRCCAWEFLAPLAAQLCGALDYAHGQKVVHRDLKPSNLMVDHGGNLKLADFGIAASISDSLSRVSLRHATSGTVTYMSPQQMNGEKPRVTDDIYSLGATLYELLASRPPFYSGNIPYQVWNTAPQALTERQAELEITNEVPDAVCALIMACLAKDAGQRPQSARAAGDVISAANAGTALGEAGVPENVPQAVSEEADFSDGESKPTGSARQWVVAAVVIVLLLIAGAGWWGLSGRHFSIHQASDGRSAPIRETNWITLFDGHSVDAWSGPDGALFPSQSWTVADGELRNIASGPKACVYTREKFRDFELEFEWKIGYGGNSGVFYSAPGTALNREFQLIDDDRRHFPNGGRSASDEDDTGALWGVIAPASDKLLFQAGEWNQGTLLVKGPHVEHWVNGRKLLEYELGSAELGQKVDQSPIAYARQQLTGQTKVDFMRTGDVPIGLQTLKGEVSFRNLRIRRL